MLDDLDVPAIKLGSGELNNRPLIEAAADLGKPLVVSTGIGTMAEVEAAYDWIRGIDETVPVAFLHCVSAYPTPMTEVNLRAMQTMAERLPTPIGFSDHTLKTVTPGIAVAAGACLIEKHVTLDTSMAGPDHEASLEPDKLAEAVAAARTAVRALGSAENAPTPSERENRGLGRKSLHAARDIPAGTTLSRDDVEVLRPAAGLPPTELNAVVGATLASATRRGEPLTRAVPEDH